MLEVENQCATTARSFGNGWQRSGMLTALADKQWVTRYGSFFVYINIYKSNKILYSVIKRQIYGREKNS